MTPTMHAFIYRRYGGPDVLELAHVPKPVAKDHEVLIRIRATTVTSGDWRVRTLIVPKGFGAIARLVFGITRPRQPILGTELAGTVEAVGSNVTQFHVGDDVVAFPGGAMGCHAEYRAMPERGAIVRKPDNLTFEEAASLAFGGTTALHFLRKAAIKAGDKLLVVGASGAVGTAIVQLGKHFGAEVTGVTSTANVELVKSLGADEVIDYTRDDFTKRSETYDVVADTVGATSFAGCKHTLKTQGRFLSIAGGLPDMLATLWSPFDGGRKVIAGPAPERVEDVQLLAELATRGVLRPVIDRRYRFEELPSAHAYVETGRKRGSVTVSV
jgi:NADPH:quinone reductase-like Zn-dependent oxidoreductase